MAAIVFTSLSGKIQYDYSGSGQVLLPEHLLINRDGVNREGDHTNIVLMYDGQLLNKIYLTDTVTIDGQVVGGSLSDIADALEEMVAAASNSSGTFTIASVTGDTFEHSQGTLQQWTLSSNATLVITGLNADEPATGFVEVTQGGAGGFSPTLPGVSNSVQVRQSAGDKTFLGYIWDGAQVYWNSDYIISGASYEAEAQAFFDANTGLDTTSKTAVNNLVKDLKYIGWSKFKAIYPFVGGSAAAHKWNLINPADTDAAFRLTFNGGWTHSATGSKGNGSTGYANTHFEVAGDVGETPVTITNLNDWKSFHISYYSRTNTVQGAGDYQYFGANRSSFNLIYSNFNTSGYYGQAGEATTAMQITSGATVFKGLLLLNRYSDALARFFRSRVQLGSDQTYTFDVGVSVSTPLYINARNNAGTAADFSNHECAFFSIGDGLTDADLTKLYNAVINFQTALSRNV